MAHPPHGLCKTKRLSLRVAPPASERRARAPSPERAEQLNPLGRWHRILSEVLRDYLHGRQFEPPIRLNPA